MNTVYFDNSATTALCREAMDAMKNVMENVYGNPSSGHFMGVEAHTVLQNARMSVLSALGVRGAKEEDLIFTASGTEADNLAILGTAHAKKILRGGKLITSDSEHPAVLRPFAQLESEGYRTAYISTKNGVFDMERFRAEMTPDTFLVSVMLVNNETGAVNDLRMISDYAKSVNPDCVVHTDAVQGFLKLPFTPEKLGCDMVTVSSHKIHGPKGVGALYVSPVLRKRRTLSPVIFGGGQEFTLRSGTENMIGIAGFGAAAMAGAKTFSDDIAHMEALRDRITAGLAALGIPCNLPLCEKRAPHIVSARLGNIKSETMLNYLSGMGVCVSSGSACSAQSGRVSSALMKFGLSERDADTTLRISLSRDNTEEEADFFLQTLEQGLSSLVKMKR